MKAYNGDPGLKERLLAEMRGHREAERLVQAPYWEGRGDGCAVCLTQKNGRYESWSHFETEWGIPAVLASLEDYLFERLPPQEAQVWPERFLGAIRPGADLSLVWPRFARWLLVDPEHGVVLRAGREYVRSRIERVAALYEREIAGERVSDEEWSIVRDAAYAAADYATNHARIAAAWAAAAATANRVDAASAAVAAAWAAVSGVPGGRVRSQADKLIELLEAA